MKIAIVMPLAIQKGGAELMLMHLLRANREGPGVPYLLAFLEDGPMRVEVEGLGYGVRVFPTGRLRQAHQYVRTVHSLRAWLRSEQVVGVMSWMAKAHVFAGPAALLADVPAVWWQHGIASGHWLDRLVSIMPAKSILCCSDAARRAQQRLTPHRSLRVIHPSVDLERFRPENLPRPARLRAQLGLPEKIPIIGIVARLERWKGIHLFLNAAARLLSRRREACFVVVGGSHFSAPHYPAELRAQALEHGISESVRFVGYQSNVAEWIQAMDILVHASIEPEPFGMVLLEGMAMGKPVIATDSGGPLEIIESGTNGLLVQPDGNAMAFAMEQLLDDEPQRRNMGVRAREHVRRFNTHRLADEVWRALNEVFRVAGADA